MSTLVGRETTTSGATNVASLAHSFTGSVAAKELLCVLVYGSGNPATVWDTPSGYTAGGSTGNGSSLWSTKCYYKTADGTETGVTFTYTSGSRPIIIIVYRFTPTSGFTWDTVDHPNDTTHENALTDQLDFDVVPLDAHTGLTATRVVIGAGLASTTTAGNAESFRETAASYIPPSGYTDTYPGTGANVVLAYGIASGALSSTKETVLWDGYRADVTTEPAETIAWGLDDDTPAGAQEFFIRYSFPLVGAAVNQNRYTQRRFIGTSLPYDLVTIRLGGE